MNRCLACVVAIALAISVGVAVRGRVRSEVKKRRDATYESILKAYTQDLKPGMSREQSKTTFGRKVLG
jgi:hypothetical protein